MNATMPLEPSSPSQPPPREKVEKKDQLERGELETLKPQQQQNDHRHICPQPIQLRGEEGYGQLLPPSTRLLPIANIIRIMKRALPESSKIAVNAREAVQASASEWVAFISSEAIDRVVAEKRKTMTSEDLVNAMLSLGFDAYASYTSQFLEKSRSGPIVANAVNEYDLEFQLAQQQQDESIAAAHLSSLMFHPHPS